MTLADVLSAIDDEISRIQQARDLLAEKGTMPHRRRPARVSPAKQARRKRTLSPEARERIAAAQRKRWAAKRKSAK